MAVAGAVRRSAVILAAATPVACAAAAQGLRLNDAGGVGRGVRRRIQDTHASLQATAAVAVLLHIVIIVVVVVAIVAAKLVLEHCIHRIVVKFFALEC